MDIADFQVSCFFVQIRTINIHHSISLKLESEIKIIVKFTLLKKTNKNHRPNF